MTPEPRDRIRDAFGAARAHGRIALAPFVTVGYPELDATTGIVKAIADAGADVIELGVPFSDPLAEGPTIQMSSHAALQAGVTPASCIETAASIRESGVETPLVFMGYYNPILSMGIDEFCRRASSAGVDGLIVPDLPTPEAGPLLDAASEHGLALMQLLALTSTEASIEAACRNARGFIYCISVLGVTGARAAMSERVRGLVGRVREHTDLPVAVGFGVSTRDHVAEIAEFADGAVVGSALISALADGPPETAASRGVDFISSLTPGTSLAGVAK